MTYFADPKQDLPAPWKKKRIVFYGGGMKIYGQIPYLLQRKLHAEFISNRGSFMGGTIVGPTGENNYTIVSYRRPNGKRHRERTLGQLMDWLYEGKGFEWAIAARGEFERGDLLVVNWFNVPPETWVPSEGKRELIMRYFLEAGDGTKEG